VDLPGNLATTKSTCTAVYTNCSTKLPGKPAPEKPKEPTLATYPASLLQENKREQSSYLPGKHAPEKSKRNKKQDQVFFTRQAVSILSPITRLPQ